MNRKLHSGVAARVLILAGFLRFYRLNEVPPGLHEDEAMDGNDAWEAWRSAHLRVFYPENHGREGLVINLQAIVLGLTAAMRRDVTLARGFVGHAHGPGRVCLAREVAGPEVGLLAAFCWPSVSGISTSPASGHDLSPRPSSLCGHWCCFWQACGGGGGMPYRMGDGARVWRVYGLGFYTYTPYRLTRCCCCGIRRLKRDYQPRTVKNVASLSFGRLHCHPALLLFAWRHPVEFFQRFETMPVWRTTNSVGELVSNTMRTAMMFLWAGDTNRCITSPARLLFWPSDSVLSVWEWRSPATLASRVIVIGLLPAIIANEGIPHAWRQHSGGAAGVYRRRAGVGVAVGTRAAVASLAVLQPARL